MGREINLYVWIINCFFEDKIDDIAIMVNDPVFEKFIGNAEFNFVGIDQAGSYRLDPSLKNLGAKLFFEVFGGF